MLHRNVIGASLPSRGHHKTRFEMLAPALTLCLFFLARNFLAATAPRSGLIDEMGIRPVWAGRPNDVARENRDGNIDRKRAIEGASRQCSRIRAW
jgi:hypothetical protein